MISAEEFVSALEKVSRTPGGYRARCPAHEDKGPSLTVGQGSRGALLVHCFAGCTFEDVCRARGVSPSDLFDKDGNAQIIRAAYRYTDEAGAFLYEKLRLEPKDFRFRSAAGAWSIKGLRKVLYRLPEVLRAAENADQVYLTEGEKDADNLRRLGVTTTTSPEGSSAWREEYTEPLRNAARVVILPDNDKPGLDYAKSVKAALLKAGVNAKIVRLPGLPEKGDVTDWLQAGGTREQLEALAAAPEAPEPVETSPEFERLRARYAQRQAAG